MLKAILNAMTHFKNFNTVFVSSYIKLAIYSYNNF